MLRMKLSNLITILKNPTVFNSVKIVVIVILFAMSLINGNTDMIDSVLKAVVASLGLGF